MAKNNNSNFRKGLCPNYGNCAKADDKEIQEIDINEEFICQNEDCGSPLIDIPPTVHWKKILIILGALILLGGIVFGIITLVKRCGGEPPPPPQEINIPNPPQAISLNKTELKLVGLNASEQLTAIIPEDADEDKKSVIWKSGDTTVCVVDNIGVVKSVADGNTVVSAYLLNGISADCTVTVEGTGKPAKIKGQNGSDKNKNGLESVSQSGSGSSTSSNSGKGSSSSSSSTISVSGGTYKGQLQNGKPEGMGTIYYTSRTVIRERPKQSIAEAGEYLVGDFRNGSLLQGILYFKNGEPKEKIIIGGGAY